MTDDELKAIEARLALPLAEPTTTEAQVAAELATEAILNTDVPALVAEVRRAVEVIRAIIYASDHCQGHSDCAHSMLPWGKARELLYEFDDEPEALANLRQLMATNERYRMK